ncbi:transposase domain-containing protein [Actinoplanes solisilvae]|uniref:transposase domain-containing protein n=1 Tax=Actinoplanes solisilvae TaxID=2486853 RepID=UPI000FDC479D|nr:transposase domain-containing protein [Actinoplanes solisilvae]
MTDDWHYTHPGTELGALQRGLGRAARRPGDRDAVLGCIARDYRWDWQVDERTVYLARLVRAVNIPVTDLMALLEAHPEDNDDNTFNNTLSVLATLGRDGDLAAVDGLRRYIGDGPRWVDVLEHIAGDWPREQWDDLLPVALARLDSAGDDPFWGGRPWTDWAGADDRIASWPPARRAPSLREAPAETLLTTVSDGDLAGQRAALYELNCRGPQPAMLPMLDRLFR